MAGVAAHLLHVLPTVTTRFLMEGEANHFYRISRGRIQKECRSRFRLLSFRHNRHHSHGKLPVPLRFCRVVMISTCPQGTSELLYCSNTDGSGTSTFVHAYAVFLTRYRVRKYVAAFRLVLGSLGLAWHGRYGLPFVPERVAVDGSVDGSLDG
jgi:hypothetical protein